MMPCHITASFVGEWTQSTWGVGRISQPRLDPSSSSLSSAAAEAGVGDRARFEVIDVTGDLPATIASGSYDLVMAFEMIHDLARPVEALATMRRLGKPDAVRSLKARPSRRARVLRLVKRDQLAVSCILVRSLPSVSASRSVELNWMNSVPASAAGVCPGGM